jgi:zinc/manganese transport system substrate-binding protein
VLAALALAGCNRSGGPAGGVGARRAGFTVVAAENFWGSLAEQLAGRRASVRSLIVDPSTDPHSYQPTAADARAIAGARMVIVNGLGYDRWATQLLEASGGDGRSVLDVGRALGLGGDANPHRWYYPGDVERVIAAIVADYARIDPADAAYFHRRQLDLERSAFAGYDALRARIRSRFAGAPVGYSESIFQGLGEDLHLELLTPRGFVKAVAEGTDVTAQDLEATERQAARRRIRVWIFNSQNATPDVQRAGEAARRAGIPVVTITETLSPAGATFEGWQEDQLRRLLEALERSHG